jgi:hypothetical protein
MHFGKAGSRPKLSLSCSRRRIRLAVAHHGAPSVWTAPAKDSSHPAKNHKKRR